MPSDAKFFRCVWLYIFSAKTISMNRNNVREQTLGQVVGRRGSEHQSLSELSNTGSEYFPFIENPN